jgi:hypothetical protein
MSIQDPAGKSGFIEALVGIGCGAIRKCFGSSARPHEPSQQKEMDAPKSVDEADDDERWLPFD